MRVAAKDQLVIESAAPYYSKLTTQKLANATMKKKKKLHNCATLAENMLFFPSNGGHKSLFTNYIQYLKKRKHKNAKKKNYHHKRTTKITTFTFYRLTKSFLICFM